MKQPDVPTNEQARLESLRSLNILDTLTEERFDRITRIAQRLFDVPIALVSLVDANRQWFKSHVGLDVQETSRDISFCGHAILNDDILVIPDARQDTRFADNPLVVNEPKVRFYAGYPLSDHSGHNLGTLCLIDREPREFSPEDVQALKDLASLVERELQSYQQATLDDLTRLSNRRGFMWLGQYSLDLCDREKLPASLVYLDLDDFKRINDLYGHAEGDRTLRQFADLARQTFRNSDIVARIGGDEFVVLLANTTKQQADEALTKFSQTLEEHNRECRQEYPLSFSHGIVEYDCQKHTTIDALLSESDKLMYELKKSKR